MQQKSIDVCVGNMRSVSTGYLIFCIKIKDRDDKDMDQIKYSTNNRYASSDFCPEQEQDVSIVSIPLTWVDHMNIMVMTLRSSQSSLPRGEEEDGGGGEGGGVCLFIHTLQMQYTTPTTCKQTNSKTLVLDLRDLTGPQRTEQWGDLTHSSPTHPLQFPTIKESVLRPGP